MAPDRRPIDDTEALRPFWTPGAVPSVQVIGGLENRGLMTDGLAARRYAVTVDTLRHMAENLERAA